MSLALDVIAAWPGAAWLQRSATAYLFVNAAHILGIALLLGSIIPLDVLLARNGVRGEMRVLADVLPRVAKFGLCLAGLTGLWLFSVRPHDYIDNPAFLSKMALLALAFLNVLWQHGSSGWAAVLQGRDPTSGTRLRAIASIGFWMAILLAGRWIGFL